MEEPETKRVVAFVDGQNLFHAAREAFGRSYPDYDPIALAKAVCEAEGDWNLTGLHFYTGVPDEADDPFWHRFWNSKLAVLGTRGVHTFRRSLRYHVRTVRLPDGSEHSYRVGHEKGIDVRLALDVLRLAFENAYDVALIFSQDQDLAEIVTEIKTIVRRERRWIRVACAYPVGPGTKNHRGMEGTDWKRIDAATYERCLDPMDHRSRGSNPESAP